MITQQGYFRMCQMSRTSHICEWFVPIIRWHINWIGDTRCRHFPQFDLVGSDPSKAILSGKARTFEGQWSRPFRTVGLITYSYRAQLPKRKDAYLIALGREKATKWVINVQIYIASLFEMGLRASDEQCFCCHSFRWLLSFCLCDVIAQCWIGSIWLYRASDNSE